MDLAPGLGLGSFRIFGSADGSGGGDWVCFAYLGVGGTPCTRDWVCFAFSIVGQAGVGVIGFVSQK